MHSLLQLSKDEYRADPEGFQPNGGTAMAYLKFKMKLAALLCSFAFLFSAQNSRAEVKLPSLLSDGMVLQQGMKVNIWGKADPGEKIVVTFKDQQASGVADKDGRWRVPIGPLSAGGPFTLTIAGKNTITLHDVLIGEVWVCSGQSNMEMHVSSAMNAQDETA